MDKKIISLITNKDENGMKMFKEHYEFRMKYVIRSFLTKLEDQEEVINDVCLIVWNKIDQYNESKGSFHTWITTICKNTAINYYKKRQQVTYELGTEKLQVEDNIVNTMLFKEEINKLSYKEKLIFYRRYYYNQSLKVIAVEMNLSERAVEGHLYRIRNKLKYALGGDSNE